MIHWASQANLFQNIRSLQDLKSIVGALDESVAVLGLIRDEDQHIPLSLSIVVGAFAIRDSPLLGLMDYCPISNQGPRGGAKKVMARSRNLLLERMIGLFRRVEGFARDLWLPQSRDLCSKQIPWGTVANFFFF